MPKKIIDANQPWTANYPPLEAWLREHGHSCMWSVRTHKGSDASLVEAWLTKPPALGIVIVVTHANRHGWDMYTGTNANNIAETLADAERRLRTLTEPTLRNAFAAGARAVEADLIDTAPAITTDELEKMFATWLESTKQPG